MISESGAIRGIIAGYSASLASEPHTAIKLFRAVDRYEYVFKVLVGCAIQTSVNPSRLSLDATYSAAFSDIARMVIRCFPRPSLGHWVGLARSLASIAGGEEGRRLAVAAKAADKVLVVRNGLAHGICPDAERAKPSLESLEAPFTLTLEALEWFLEHADGDLAALPLFDGVVGIYNSLHHASPVELSEYLDYGTGAHYRSLRDPNFASWFASLAGLGEHTLPPVARALLEGYMPRLWWEAEVGRLLAGHALVVADGEAGVGKSALLARIAEQEGAPCFFFRKAQESSKSGILPWQHLYRHIRAQGADLPALDPSGGGRELAEALRALAMRGSAYRREPLYVVDGIDEIDDDEISEFMDFLPLAAGLAERLLLGTRSRQLAERLCSLRLPSARLRLPALDQAEMREWIRRIGIPFPSIAVLEKLEKKTGGNLLHLACIPKSCDESGLDAFLDTTPAALESLFEDAIRKATLHHPLAERSVALLGCTPDGIAPPFLAEYFGISSSEARDLLGTLEELTREGEGGRRVVFHEALHAHLRSRFKDAIDSERRELLDRLAGSSLPEKLGGIRGIPSMFKDAEDWDGLLRWMRGLARNDKALEIGPERIEFIRTLIDGAALVAREVGDRSLAFGPELLGFVSANFLVIFDFAWANRLLPFFEKLRDAAFLLPEEMGAWLDLCRLAAEYRRTSITEAEASRAFATLLDRPVAGTDIRFAIRAWDYRGLYEGRFGRLADAAISYSTTIELARSVSDDLWLGFALINRGKILLRQGRVDEALADIEQAAELRRKIALSDELQRIYRGDILTREHALITASVGYLDLATVAESRCQSELADESMKRSWQLLLMAWKADKGLAEAKSGTSRVLLHVADWARAKGDAVLTATALEMLRSAYIPPAWTEGIARARDYLGSPDQGDSRS